MKIHLLSHNRTASFAAEELCRILHAIGETTTEMQDFSAYSEEAPALWLGTLDQFAQIQAKKTDPDPIDDEIYIQTSGKCGIIAGLNPRSLLIAVYRYATELGCRFLNVGREGEYLPEIDVAAHDVSVHEVPSYRHRGVCIEGAVSRENVAQMIDLLPKLGMNSYFIQFREAYTFFERWYAHRLNPYLAAKEPYPVEDARACCAFAADEMAKRGIVYHAVGHGWTCEPFGVSGLAWEEWTEEIPEETLQNFAMIDGKRQLFDGVPLNTNACYGNSDVRATMIRDICTYISEHPTVDLIHVWLADGMNNQCECELCQKKLPADWYVLLLNELDAELTRQKKDTKIVFLLYVDLLWPPKQEKLVNQERFTLMFAPITRSYRKSFEVDGALPALSEYKRNQNIMPKSVAENVAHLAAWQKMFSGDGFDYDYHFMWAHYYDPSLLKISEILHDDIQKLSDIGLDGYISCQLGRVMFPNALNMVTMGRTLWDKNISYDGIVRDYFIHTYGAHHDLIYSELKKLSELFFKLNMEDMKREKDPSRAVVCKDILAALHDFRIPDETGAAFEYLRYFVEIWSDYAEILLAIFEGKTDVLREMVEAMRAKIWKLEPKVQEVLDVWEFDNILLTDILKKM